MLEFKLINDKVMDLCVYAIQDGYGKIVTIGHPKRTLKQNNYYHNILTIIEKETGQDHDDLHDWIKFEKLGPRVVEYEGQTFLWPKHSKDLTTKDFPILITAAQIYARNAGLIIPSSRQFGIE